MQFKDELQRVIWDVLCDTDDMSEMGRAEQVADAVLAIPRIGAALQLLADAEQHKRHMTISAENERRNNILAYGRD